MKQYLDVVRKVLETGTRKENRTSVDTLSTFNINYEIDLKEGFPLLTTKEISWKNIVVENLWFLSGDTNIKLLKKHKCKFWDPWANEAGDVPSAYGNFWRNFPVHGNGDLEFCDQVSRVLAELKRNQNSRRLVISAWSPKNALDSKLPPCHVIWILNVQSEKDGTRTLNLHLSQRSCDVALGLPYNIAGYSLLLQLFSQFTGLTPGKFAHTIVDGHIYTAKPDGSSAEYDHVPGLKEQLSRTPRNLPKLQIKPDIQNLDDVKKLLTLDTREILDCFKLVDYNPYPAIKFKVAV